MESPLKNYEQIAHLVTRSRNGDANAFETLVRTHIRTAVAVALAVTGRTEDAEDVAQDAFVLAYNKLDSCSDPSRFSGWLLQIVRNQAINWLHRRRRHERQHKVDTTDTYTESGEQDSANRQLLLFALNDLDQTQREIVVLHALEGWTHEEIAEHLDINPQTSRWHLFQARHAMKQFMTNTSVPRKKVIHE